jgi:HAD superfamily hydrolase (TIGR01509 family)
MIQALIFDFDGLIIDTELPDYEVWQEIYQTHGCDLAFDDWSVGIGSIEAFNPYDHLEAQIGRPIDRVGIHDWRRQRYMEIVLTTPILPGVEEYITDAKRLGLKLGVASSSPRSWVNGHLDRLALVSHFDYVACGDQVPRTKPDPAVYQAALAGLDVRPHQAIALEDSLNGVLAAKAAGIFCVAVPNTLTRRLPLERADLRLESLAQLSLEDLLARVAGNGE